MNEQAIADNAALRQVAVIGAGVAGLALGWHLRGAPVRLTYYEKNPHPGGNCRTGWVSVGGEYRFCDLGVNDFNTRAYRQVVQAMDELGIAYELLEDSACFYTLKGALYTTTEHYWYAQGKPLPHWRARQMPVSAYTIGGLPYQPMPEHLARDYARFKVDAPRFLMNNPADAASLTIGQYLERANPPYHPDFGRLCIFPRVNAMYFVSNAFPARDMPFTAVMHYYMLQEGFGTYFDGPLRMYFRDGAQNWIERLAQALQADIRHGEAVQVDWLGGAQPWGVLDARGRLLGRYDQVVFASHADQALKALRPTAPPWQALRALLQRFPYAPSTGFAHTYAGVLPPDPNLWRTYNVRVHDLDPNRPPGVNSYSMTYLCNKHQNDARSGSRNRYGGAQMFVSLNPFEEIPEEHILTDANTGEPLIWSFPHNVLTFDALQAQADLARQQGSFQGLYFVGGWCYGAGLHEECWVQARDVAHLLRDARASELDFYHQGRVPRHVRDAVPA